jgi:hypothetical protein
MDEGDPGPVDRGKLDLLSDPGHRDLLEDGERRDLFRDLGEQDLARDRGVQDTVHLGAAWGGLIPEEVVLEHLSARSAGIRAPARTSEQHP